MAYENIPTEELEGMAMGMAGEVDAARENTAMARAPEGDFSLGRLNTLVDAFNDVAELFPDMPMYPSFSEEVDMFPAEFVTAIDAVNAAATDAMMDDMVIEVMDITDDQDLARAAGQLKALAKDKDFQRFLKQEYTSPDVVEEEMVAPAAPEEGGEVADDLFMSRM
tara:strand:- start:22122 stop:22619 length:498 start_codon:yes stop_codon:yes gene_type:complete